MYCRRSRTSPVHLDSRLDVCRFSRIPQSLCLNGINARLFLEFSGVLELHAAVGQGEQGMVSSYAHVVTGLYSSASLPDDDCASPY
jgi:hypothetical protein